MKRDPHPLVALCLGFFTGLSPRVLVELSVTFTDLIHPTKEDIMERHGELEENEVEKVLDAFEKIRSYVAHFDEQWGEIMLEPDARIVSLAPYSHRCDFCGCQHVVHIGNASELEATLSSEGCRNCGLIPSNLHQGGNVE